MRRGPASMTAGRVQKSGLQAGDAAAYPRRASMRQPDDPGDTDPQPRPAVPVPWNDRAIWRVGDGQVGL